MTQHDGGPAFPRPATQYIPQTTNSVTHLDQVGWYSSGGGFHDPGHAGISARDYFAAKAMAAIIAGTPGKLSAEKLAQEAYGMADAMLEAREAKT